MFICPTCSEALDTVTVEYFDVTARYKGTLLPDEDISEIHESEEWTTQDGPFYACPKCTDDITEALKQWSWLTYMRQDALSVS